MGAPLKVFLSDIHDPWFNLATEDWIFREMSPDTRVLYLWRNHESVVIGRFQNPWLECHTEKMARDGVKLVRRQSGGGTVYHDLGNMNFTFLSGKKDFSKEDHHTILNRAIHQFDVPSYASPRNDLLVDDREGAKKISGSAFKEKRDRSFHHGTLLIDSDLNRLQDYLNPAKRQMVGKGVQSVRSKVANLRDFNPKLDADKLSQAIIYEFCDFYQNDCSTEYLNYTSLSDIPCLNNYYQKLKDWKWRFGETPKFQLQLEEQFDWGEVSLNLSVHKGTIKRAAWETQDFHPEITHRMGECLGGVLYTSEALRPAFSRLQEEFPFLRPEFQELAEWLVHKIR